MSYSNQLWKNLLTKDILTRGYHLARKDAKNNFICNDLEINSFAQDLDNRIHELLYRLRNNIFIPKPIITVEVPKTSLAIRFGSVISFEDSVILHAILYLIAPIIDRQISSSVYSYRVKEKYTRSDEIFKESNQYNIPILNIAKYPYLKAQTISNQIDPLDPWYANWPEFDRESRKAFDEEGFSFMAVTDIVSYFDNIQLSILRDVLSSFLPQEHKIINLLLTILEHWVCHTHFGTATDRGIPQGNQVSSFLGNIFLKDLDQEFDSLCQKHPVKYFRYMDDIRIFTKTEEDARLSLLKMNRALRKLHLNIQSSKTKILREYPKKEISKSLIDDRLDSLNIILGEKEPFRYREKVKEIVSRASKYGEEPILKKRTPVALSAINSRLFRRWASFCLKFAFSDYISRLEKEIQLNPDPRITKLAVRTIKVFPQKKSFVLHILKFIQSNINVFPQQEAELLKGARYLYQIPREVMAQCRENLFSNYNSNFQVKIESLRLLFSVGLAQEDYIRLNKLFLSEENTYLRSLLAVAMLTISPNPHKLLKELLLYPNTSIQETAKYIWQIQNEPNLAEKKMKYIFTNKKSHMIRERVIDCMPDLLTISQSRNRKIINNLKEYIKKSGLLQRKYTITHPLQEIFVLLSKEPRITQ